MQAVAGQTPRLVSGVTGEGVKDLLREVQRLVDARRKAEKAPAEGEEEAWSP